MKNKQGFWIIIAVVILALAILLYTTNNLSLSPKTSTKTNTALKQQIQDIEGNSIIQQQAQTLLDKSLQESSADLVESCTVVLTGDGLPSALGPEDEPNSCACLKAIAKYNALTATDKCNSAKISCTGYNSCKDIIPGIQTCGVPIPPTTKAQCSTLNTCTGGTCGYYWAIGGGCYAGGYYNTCPSSWSFIGWDCEDLKDSTCTKQSTCNSLRTEAQNAKAACEAAHCSGCDNPIPPEANCQREIPGSDPPTFQNVC